MKKLRILPVVSILALAAANTFAQEQNLRTVALVVQNHDDSGEQIPLMSLTDALTAKLAGCDLQAINPYNSVGVNQNRDAHGEKTPEVSAIELARKLKADGAITVAVRDVFDTPIGTPPILHQYSMHITLNIADAWSGATVIKGENVEKTSLKYTNNQIAQNKRKILRELMYSAADECVARLKKNPNLLKWSPTPPPPPPTPITPDDPWLALSDVDGAMQRLMDSMRMNSVFRDNYDTVQKSIERSPLVVVSGLVDLTDGKSPTVDIANLLGAASQNVRMMLLNSRLFEAKDDAIVTAMTDRIIKNGNSPTEDGELMAALKQHGSPDFFMVGDVRYFAERKRRIYRFRLALHNLHTGKIVWEGFETITKNTEASK